MAKKVTNKELFGNKFLIDPKKVAEEFLKIIRDLKKEFAELAKINQQIAKQDVAGFRVKQLKELQEAEKKAIKTANDFQKLQKEEIKLKKQLEKQDDEIIKGKIRLQRANKEQRKQLEAQVILEQKEIRTLNDLKDANKALRVERDRLDLADDADRIAEINAQLDENTEKIKENVDALSKQKINIGNYKDSVKEALEETDVFNQVQERLGLIGGIVIGQIKKVNERLEEQKQATDEAGKATDRFGNRLRRLNQILKASLITAIIASLAALVKAFVESRKGARELQIITQQISNTVLIFGGRAIEVAQAIINVYVTAFKAAKRATTEFRIVLLELQTVKVDPIIIAGKKIWDGFKLGSKESIDKLQELKKELEEEPEVGIADVISAIGNIGKATADAFSDFGEVFVNTNSALREQLEAEDRLIDKIAILQNEILELSRAEQIQQQIADDSTRSFIEKAEAIENVIRIQDERLRTQVKIAELEQAQAVRAIKIELERGKLQDRFNEKQIKNLSFLKDVQAADEVSIENIERLKEATRELTELETERFVGQLEANRLLREILRDRFEQDLDFAIDVFDRTKSVNERIVASDQVTLEEKFKIVAETEALTEKSFQNQIKLTEDFIAKSNAIQEQGEQERIINRKLTVDEIQAIEAETRKEAASLNLAQLTNLKDEEEVRKRLLDQGVADEITQNRIREIIIERKTFLQDVVDLQQDVLNQAIEEARIREEAEQNLLQFRKEVESTIAAEEFDEKKKAFEQEKKLNKESLKEAQSALENKKQLLLEELALETAIKLEQAELEDDQTRIIEEENEKRRKILKENLEAQQDLEKTALAKRLEERKKFGQSLSELVEFEQDQQQQRFDQRIKNIDDEISKSKEREDEFRQLARERILDADENLAFEQRKQAELEKERASEQKRQEVRELGFTALKTYAAKVEAGDKNALVNTFKDIGLLRAAIAALDGFYEGSEKVKDDLNPVVNTGRDDYAIRVDGDERVVPGDINKKMEGISNPQLGRIVEKFKKGELKKSVSTEIMAVPFQSNGQVLAKFDELSQEVRANSRYIVENMPVQDFKYKEVDKMVESTTKRRNKILREHRKIGGIWG